MKNSKSPKNKKHVIFETESDNSFENSKFRISANPLPIINDSLEDDPKDIYKDGDDSIKNKKKKKSYKDNYNSDISERSEDDLSNNSKFLTIDPYSKKLMEEKQEFLDTQLRI